MVTFASKVGCRKLSRQLGGSSGPCRLFEARMGRLYGFRFRDPLDHSSALPGLEVSAEDQVLGVGDGSQTTYQLSIHYGEFARPVTKPVPGTVRISFDGIEQVSGWSAAPESGEVLFDTPPSPGVQIRAGFEYDCPVRFESDQINSVIEAFGAGRIVSVSLIELL